jgi:large subunit ribosomal protein L6
LGYKASIQQDKSLLLHVGFSHPIVFKPPEGITISIKENRIIIEGIDKALVGQVAANIRKIRPAGPYKIKGLRYVDEVISLKPGKARTK